jgi:hypothetical protein
MELIQLARNGFGGESSRERGDQNTSFLQGGVLLH